MCRWLSLFLYSDRKSTRKGVSELPQAAFDYHYGLDAERYAFFRIPKILMTEPYFDTLSTDAKLLYKLKLDAMKRQGARTDLTSCQVGTKLRADELLAEKADDSARQIQRYVRLTKLIPVLLEQVDSGKLKLVPAADYISHLAEKEQTYLALVMERDEVSPSVGQAKKLKEMSIEGKLDDNVTDLIMREEKQLERKVTLDGNWVKRRFPQSMTPQQIVERINKALDLLERTERRKQEQSR